jgi:hypothetical protein
VGLQSVPTESVARAARVSPMGSVSASVSAGRRSVALTVTPAIARASEIGETDPFATPTRPAHRPPGATAMSSRSRATLSTQASSLRLRRPQRVIRQIAPSSRGVPLPVRAAALPGRATQTFPSCFAVARRRSWGSTRPFAGLIPLTGGRSRHTMVAAWQATSSRRSTCRLGISAGPGPRVVRASASAPIDFRRGDRPPVGGNEICKSDRPGMRMASTSGLQLPSAVRRSGTRSSRATILPWALPLAGLSGTFPCIAPGPTPRAITSPRNRHTASYLPRAAPIHSWAWRRSFRSRTTSDGTARRADGS